MSSVSYINPYPFGGEKKYGLNQLLGITTLISGTEDCGHELNFYLKNMTTLSGTTIGTTISGTTCSGIYSTALATTSGVEYNWYATTTISGNEQVFISDTYDFYVRYMCSGICNVNEVSASGIKVDLHRRSTGELLERVTTAGTGGFIIDTPYNEYHYAVALYSGIDTNALIYDHIIPT